MNFLVSHLWLQNFLVLRNNHRIINWRRNISPIAPSRLICQKSQNLLCKTTKSNADKKHKDRSWNTFPFILQSHLKWKIELSCFLMRKCSSPGLQYFFSCWFPLDGVLLPSPGLKMLRKSYVHVLFFISKLQQGITCYQVNVCLWTYTLSWIVL